MQNLKFKNIKDIKNIVDATFKSDAPIDFSSMNMFESLKYAVLSSEYYYMEHPNKKLKCKLPSDDVKNLISSFKLQNLEFV